MLFLKILFTLWLIGFLITLGFHLWFLPMVQPGLAAMRAALWPVFLATGRPRGTPLPMD